MQLSGSEGLLAAVPAVLGFKPEDSSVVISFKKEDGKLRVYNIARADLGKEAELIANHVKKHADAVAFVFYSPVAPPSERYTELLPDTPVIDVIWVDTSRGVWLSQYGGSGVVTSDDEQSQVMGAAMAFAGRVVADSREAAVTNLAGPLGDDADKRRQLIDESADYYVGLVKEDVLLQAQAVFERLRDARMSGVKMDDVDAARFVSGVGSVWVRDHLIPDMLGNIYDWVPVLVDVMTWCPDDRCAELAVLTAIGSYRLGDGIATKVTLERAFRANPDHRLVNVLMMAVSSGMDPSMFDTLAEIGN